MKLKRRMVEEKFRDKQVMKMTELTYHYEDEEEYKKHLKEMTADGYVLEGYTVLNLGDSESDRLVPAAQYSKRERIEIGKGNDYEEN